MLWGRPNDRVSPGSGRLGETSGVPREDSAPRECCRNSPSIGCRAGVSTTQGETPEPDQRQGEESPSTVPRSKMICNMKPVVGHIACGGRHHVAVSCIKEIAPKLVTSRVLGRVRVSMRRPRARRKAVVQCPNAASRRARRICRTQIGNVVATSPRRCLHVQARYPRRAPVDWRSSTACAARTKRAVVHSTESRR